MTYFDAGPLRIRLIPSERDGTVFRARVSGRAEDVLPATDATKLAAPRLARPQRHGSKVEQGRRLA